MIPGYEPVELDLEKLFLLSVSKENLDFRKKMRKTYPTKFSKHSEKISNIDIYIYIYTYIYMYMYLGDGA